MSALLLMMLLGLFPAFAQEEVPEYEMTTYQLVFVVPDPEFEEEPGINPAHADHRIERVRTAGNLFMRNLVNDDVAVIAGPLLDHDRIDQVAVLDVDSREDAERLFQRSPAIETGRNRIEVYTWWAAQDILRKPKDAGKTRLAHLGLLKRPPDAPTYSDERLEELQRGHLENIRKMAESGELVIAGPLEDGGDLRGILVFRTQDADRIRELVAPDPAVKAGRLELELYPWRVPRRSFPPRRRSNQ
jgi:uncharacterized protein YciI